MGNRFGSLSCFNDEDCSSPRKNLDDLKARLEDLSKRSLHAIDLRLDRHLSGLLQEQGLRKNSFLERVANSTVVTMSCLIL